jgi:hypothetical protein
MKIIGKLLAITMACPLSALSSPITLMCETATMDIVPSTLEKRSFLGGKPEVVFDTDRKILRYESMIMGRKDVTEFEIIDESQLSIIAVSKLGSDTVRLIHLNKIRKTFNQFTSVSFVDGSETWNALTVGRCKE